MADQASPGAGERRVRAPDLQASVEQVFGRCGMEEPDARLLAETLVELAPVAARLPLRPDTGSIHHDVIGAVMEPLLFTSAG